MSEFPIYNCTLNSLYPPNGEIGVHVPSNEKSCEHAGIQSSKIRLSNLMAQKLQNSNIYIDSIKKNWQKSLVRINFHWPWATGPLLKSMTGYLKISSLYTIYSSLTLKYMQCTSIYIFFIQCTSIYIFCITFHFRLLPL